DLDGAIAAYREAIRLKKDDALAHYNLGIALKAKGDVDGAIAEYREAIGPKKDFTEAHCILANSLREKGRLVGAIAEQRGAIALKKDYALAHLNLGIALRDKGQFVEALTSLRRGHELGSKSPGWPSAAAQWVKACERLVELDGKLPAILGGTAQPANVMERI